jgi:hypothetical protein
MASRILASTPISYFTLLDIITFEDYNRDAGRAGWENPAVAVEMPAVTDREPVL